MNTFKEWVIARGEGRYYYRVHPKADLLNIIRNGLYSYSPGDGPGAFIDRPDMERWPDQDMDRDEPQTCRLYVADSKWEIGPDRFYIRIPVENISSRLEKDSLGDYFIDTGTNRKLILKPDQFDIDIGDKKWLRADMAGDLPALYWKKAYYKKPGFYGNRYEMDT